MSMIWNPDPIERDRAAQRRADAVAVVALAVYFVAIVLFAAGGW